MQDLVSTVLDELRIGDGRGALMLAEDGSDTKHPDWGPHSQKHIPIFCATAERVDGRVVYEVCVISTGSREHEDRRARGLAPRWERFRFPDADGAAGFSLAHLSRDRNPMVGVYKAESKPELFADDDTLPDGVTSVYSMGTWYGRLPVESLSEMTAALKMLTAQLVEA